MPRVFAKKRLEFKNRDTGDTAATSMLDFCDLPDWATGDPLYQWAKASGDLDEMGEKKAVRSKSQERREAIQKAESKKEEEGSKELTNNEPTNNEPTNNEPTE